MICLFFSRRVPNCNLRSRRKCVPLLNHDFHKCIIELTLKINYFLKLFLFLLFLLSCNHVPGNGQYPDGPREPSKYSRHSLTRPPRHPLPRVQSARSPPPRLNINFDKLEAGVAISSRLELVEFVESISTSLSTQSPALYPLLSSFFFVRRNDMLGTCDI